MEETNIPDQLTYHAPSQETTKEPKDALFMAYTSKVLTLIKKWQEANGKSF